MGALLADEQLPRSAVAIRGQREKINAARDALSTGVAPVPMGSALAGHIQTGLLMLKVQPTHPPAGEEDKGDAFYQNCIELAQKLKITVEVTSNLKSYGASSGGQILLRAEKNKTAMAATLLHEIAHERLHQRKTETQKLDRETKELEAEAIAFMVCSHFGIEVPSYKYLATWQKTHQLMDSLKRISVCSHELIADLESLGGKVEPRDKDLRPESHSSTVQHPKAVKLPIGREMECLTPSCR